MSTNRELVASVNGIEVGTLRDEANIWSFEYSENWQEASESFDLAPNLPRDRGTITDGSSQRPVQWFFDNLLPEEQARAVLSAEAKIDSNDAFGLLAYYGKESAGAITLLRPGEVSAESGLRPLSDEALHARIANLPRQSLAAQAPKHMSNAGAQHKLAVCVVDGKLFEPVGATASTHLLKPDHVDAELWPNTVANEYFVMRLARRLGLSVPDVAIRYVPDPVYLIQRFDRQTLENEIHRLHAVDACQLLGVDRTFKYQQSSLENLHRCVEFCRDLARSRLRVLSWVIFNVLTGNADAHLKNLSFLVSPRGIVLAPFYDLVSTESCHTAPDSQPRWTDVELSTQMGDAKTFGAVTRKDCYAAADALGVPQRVVKRMLDAMLETIGIAADEIFKEFESMKFPDPATRGGQIRALMKIRGIVIKEMTRKLSS